MDDWQTFSPPANQKRIHRVFLVGKSGDYNLAYVPNTPPALDLLQQMAANAGKRSTTLFLGDQIPCCGFPDSSSAKRAEMETILRRQLDAIKDAPGEVYFIAGENDWDGRRGSLKARKRQEKFIEGYLNRGNVFLPNDGFPGPKVVKLQKDLYLFLLDSQWWLSEGEKAFGDAGSYELNEASDFLRELDEKLYKHRNDKIIIAGHHPLFSNGEHGGHFSALSHLTPFPVIGSFEPFFRRYIGLNQDLSHHSYRLYRKELLKLFEEKELVYVSSHEKSLQYFEKGTNRARRHFIVSGSAANGEFVAQGRGADFVSDASGFMVLDYYEDNSIWLSAWSAPPGEPNGVKLFEYPIQPAAPRPVEKEAPIPTNLPSYKDSTIVIAANPEYNDASPLKRFVRGNLHRNLWGTPIEVPYLDLGVEAGGLKPIKMGGRGQSISLRLANEAGKEFVIRSVDKVAGKAWTRDLQSSFLRKLIQDQMAMLHPYSAFVLPPLANAAGVYHTNPKLFYVPNDPRLGLSQKDLAGQLVLFEERPDDDMSHISSMGNTEEVVSSFKMLEAVTSDNDHRVDDHSFARARLFDMLINDWDRHQDQWRWASFEPADKKGKIYRPIPRDRDVAFSIVDGIIPTLSKIFFDPKFQEFEDSYGYIKGLNKNGLALDRRFTSRLTLNDWIAIADSIQQGVTDEVIESAIATWPAPIREKSGEYTIQTLKNRRDKLPVVAAKYYLSVLAPTVDVLGSDKHERFEVTHLNDRETEVVVYKTTKEGITRKEIFRRTFLREETREIRLYGLDGNDQFHVHGDVKDAMFIIAVGGPGVDHFVNDSRVSGFRRHSRFYDTESNNTFDTNSETRVFKSDDPANNAYDFHGHKYDLTRPTAFFGSNKDDGIMVGGGVRISRHRFRKTPFARLHVIAANIATNANSFNLVYEGTFTDTFSDWDLFVKADFRSPNTIRNFYGFGNETTNQGEEESFYRTRLGQISLKTVLQKDIEQGAQLRLGPKFYFANLERDTTRFLWQLDPERRDALYDGRWFGGVEAELTMESVDDPINPRQGFRWLGSIDANLGITDKRQEYSTLTTALSLYFSTSTTRQYTLALRLGGTHVFGDFPFYAGATLGSKASLRGYVSSRFTGRSSFYQNAELRLELSRFSSYIATGSFGVSAFLDNGRVWADDEHSNSWHQGYGGGAWLSLFNRLVVSSSFGFSNEDETVNLQIGFLY